MSLYRLWAATELSRNLSNGKIMKKVVGKIAAWRRRVRVFGDSSTRTDVFQIDDEILGRFRPGSSGSRGFRSGGESHHCLDDGGGVQGRFNCEEREGSMSRFYERLAVTWMECVTSYVRCLCQCTAEGRVSVARSRRALKRSCDVIVNQGRRNCRLYISDAHCDNGGLGFLMRNENILS